MRDIKPAGHNKVIIVTLAFIRSVILVVEFNRLFHFIPVEGIRT